MTVSRWMTGVEVSVIVLYMCDSVKVDDECRGECHSSTCVTVSRWMMSVEVSVTVLHV